MMKSFLNKLSVFVGDILTTFRGLPLWQIALMILLPDVLVIIYLLVIKKLAK